MHGDERGVDRRRRRPFRRFVFFRLKSEKTVTFSFFNLFFFPSSSSSSSHRRRTQKMAALALVPFAPLLALPPRLVAAAASCACLLGGAALGVARVRAGEPRAAEVATATFAAVGATLAVSAWWLLASGGVGTVRGGNGGGDERGKGKWRREAVRGAVNNNNSGNNNNGTGASPSSSSSSSSSASSSSRRPLALAARFASVPWKAAQRASRAGNALCPFTGRSFFFEGGERKRGGKTAVPFPFFFLVLTSRECPLDQNNNNKTNTGERASLRCPCCRATVSRNAWHSGDKFCGLGLGGGPLLWQPAEAALEKVKKKSSSFFRARRKGTLFFFLSFFSFVSQNQRFSFFSPLLHTPQKNNRTTPRWRTESSSTRPWTSRGTFCSVSVFFFFFFFFFARKKTLSKKTKNFLSLSFLKKQKKNSSSSAAVSPCCIGCARALKTTNLLPRLGATSACVALALALVPWGLGASLRQLDGAVEGASAGSRVMATALCLALWCAAQCAASLAHAVGAAVTFAESYECCRFGAEAGGSGGGGGSSATFSVSPQQQQQQTPGRSRLSAALISLAAGPKWRGAIGGGKGSEKPPAKETREIGTQTGGAGAEETAADATAAAASSSTTN